MALTWAPCPITHPSPLTPTPGELQASSRQCPYRLVHKGPNAGHRALLSIKAGSIPAQ